MEPYGSGRNSGTFNKYERFSGAVVPNHVPAGQWDNENNAIVWEWNSLLSSKMLFNVAQSKAS